MVTSDTGFYESRDRRALAVPLRDETSQQAHEIRIYPDLSAFLETIDNELVAVDEAAIARAIAARVLTRASKIAEEYDYILHAEPQAMIRGYGTAKPWLIAVSCEIEFRADAPGHPEEIKRITIKGVFWYDPTSNVITKITAGEASIQL